LQRAESLATRSTLPSPKANQQRYQSLPKLRESSATVRRLSLDQYEQDRQRSSARFPERLPRRASFAVPSLACLCPVCRSENTAPVTQYQHRFKPPRRGHIGRHRKIPYAKDFLNAFHDRRQARYLSDAAGIALEWTAEPRFENPCVPAKIIVAHQSTYLMQRRSMQIGVLHWWIRSPRLRSISGTVTCSPSTQRTMFSTSRTFLGDSRVSSSTTGTSSACCCPTTMTPVRNPASSGVRSPDFATLRPPVALLHKSPSVPVDAGFW